MFDNATHSLSENEENDFKLINMYVQIQILPAASYFLRFYNFNSKVCHTLQILCPWALLP